MYHKLKTLNHLNNFIQDGGLRTKDKPKDLKNYKYKISVITVVKNSVSGIEKTINSVLEQSFRDIEYIIIDGNSTDGTKEKIIKYENRLDYWCSINDKGIYDAMNYGLMLASGKIISIINSGDIFTPNAFKIISRYFENNNQLDYLFGTVERHYLKNNVIIKSGFNKKRIRYNFDSQTCHSSGFFIKEDVQQMIGLYNLNYKCSSDYDLFYKLLTNNNYIGEATKKDEVIGIVESGGFSSKYGFWNRLIEETKIRFDNKQNIFLIIIIFFNVVIKNFLKKIFKN